MFLRAYSTSTEIQEFANKCVDHRRESPNKESHPFGWLSLLVDLRRFELPTPTMRTNREP